MTESEKVIRAFTQETCAFITQHFPQGEHNPAVIAAYLSTVITLVWEGFCKDEVELVDTVRAFATMLHAMPEECYFNGDEEG